MNAPACMQPAAHVIMSHCNAYCHTGHAPTAGSVLLISSHSPGSMCLQGAVHACSPSMRAQRSRSLLCLQGPGPRHRRGPRLTGTLDRKMNSLEGHLRQLPVAGQRRRPTHDSAVAASAPELGAAALKADKSAGEELHSLVAHHSVCQSLLACGYCAAEKTVGLPFTALMSTLSWKKAALEAVPGLEFHALPADTSPAASKTHLKPVTALRSAGRHAPLAEHRGAPTHNVEGCGSVHIQQDGC